MKLSCQCLREKANAKRDKTRTTRVKETVTDVKFIPMGVKPRKSPTKLVMLKLRATDKTSSSTRYMSSLLAKSKRTKQ